LWRLPSSDARSERAVAADAGRGGAADHRAVASRDRGEVAVPSRSRDAASTEDDRRVVHVGRTIDRHAPADGPRDARRDARAGERGITRAHHTCRTRDRSRRGRTVDHDRLRGAGDTVGIDTRQHEGASGGAGVQRRADGGGATGTTLVQLTVAVVVERIDAELGRVGMNRRVRGTTIVVVRHLTRGADRTRDHVDRAGTVTIVIGIDIAVGGHAAFVDQGVAVVVDGVAADLGRVGVGGRLRVVAVTAGGRRPGRTHGRIVEVASTHTVAVGIAVGVAGDADARQVLVELPVAVVVDHVTDLLLKGVLCRARIVAVGRVGDATSRTQPVDLKGRTGTESVVVSVDEAARDDASVIHDRIAVLIGGIATNLDRVGVDGRDTRVAVARDSDLACGAGGRHQGRCHTRAIAVTVGVDVARDDRTRETVVSRAVTIVVDRVARFGGTRMDAVVAVVAVVVQTDLTRRAGGRSPCRTRDQIGRTGAVAIAIGVGVAVDPVAGEAIVGQGRAVVIHRVADFGRPGEYRGARVVAVAEDSRSAGRADVGIGMDHPGTGTEPVHVAVVVASGRHADEHVVDGAIAVVVERVAYLGRAREDLVVVVVAVVSDLHFTDETQGPETHHASTRAEPVTIGVGKTAHALTGVATIDHPIAVVVDEVADLGRAGMNRRVRGGAVVGNRRLTRETRGPEASHGKAEAEPVTVDVFVAVHGLARETFVDLSIAVVVDGGEQVADLGRAGMGARNGIVAVARHGGLTSSAGRAIVGDDPGAGSESVTVRIDVADHLRTDEPVVGYTVAVVVDEVAGLCQRRRGRRVARHRRRRLVADEDAGLRTGSDTFDASIPQQTDTRSNAAERDVGGDANRVDARRQLVLPAELSTGTADRAVPPVGGIDSSVGCGLHRGHAGALRPRVVGGVTVLGGLGAVARRAGVRALVEVARLVAGRRAGAREGLSMTVGDVARIGTADPRQRRHAHHRRNGEMSTEHVSLIHLSSIVIFSTGSRSGCSCTWF
jgi:hypothetical protein